MMGELLVRFRTLQVPADLELDDRWADPDRLASDAAEWAKSTVGLDHCARDALKALINELPALFCGRQPVLAHGDLWDDLVVVTGGHPPGDGLARSVVGLVAAEPGQLDAREWLAFLARTAAGEVAGRLERAGYLTQVRRRPWRGQRWVPVDADCAFAPLLRVKSALGSSAPASAHNGALAGLAAACGLGHRIGLYLPPPAQRRLQQAALQLHPQLTAATATG